VVEAMVDPTLFYAALKGAASAAASAGTKFAAEKAFNRETRAVEEVIAMAIVRAIEQSRPAGAQGDEAWWSRAGQRVIAPFLHRDVSGPVLQAAAADPDPVAVEETLVVALDKRGHDLAELARGLGFDAELFLSQIPSIIIDELNSAAVEPNSPLLALGQFAVMRRIENHLNTTLAHRPDDATSALAASIRVVLTQFGSRIADFREYVLNDMAAAGEELLGAEWDALLRDGDGPVLGLHWDLFGWTTTLEALVRHRKRWMPVVEDCSRFRVQLQEAEVQIGTVFHGGAGVSVVGDLELLEHFLDWSQAPDTGQPSTETQTRLLLTMARAAQAAFAEVPGGDVTPIPAPGPDRKLYDPDWLANLLERLERRPRRSELPPTVPESTSATLAVINSVWDKFAAAARVRDLLIERLHHFESSGGRLAGQAGRTAIDAGWQDAVHAGLAQQRTAGPVDGAASGVFARRNSKYGIAFEIIAPAPADDEITREAQQTGWTRPLVLGRLSRDASVWAGVQDPSPFWMHDIQLSAVTRDGTWLGLELLINLLDRPDAAPVNRHGAQGHIDFGGEPITTSWTFLMTDVDLDDVRWWVVRWPEAAGRTNRRELLRIQT
jgi:hypothetical protein